MTSRLTGSSSTSRTRRPSWSRRSVRSADASGVRAFAPRAAAPPRRSRAVNQKTLPTPGVLVAPASPPISSASCFVIARPRPVPPWVRVVELSACSNAEKSFGITSGAMPIPVSCTSKRTSTLSGVVSTAFVRSVTVPVSVNFTAFVA